jgi:methyltransferase
MDADEVAVCLLVVIVAQRVLELRLARSNAAIAFRRGAQEFGASHYPVFFVLHTAWMLGWIGEAWTRGPTLSPQSSWWLGGFVLAGALRYWAIASLGTRWNTRVLVVPGDVPLRRGPYRVLAHPNYLAVAIELLCVPMIFGAWIVAAICSIANAVLLLGIRIPTENQALARGNSSTAKHP